MAIACLFIAFSAFANPSSGSAMPSFDFGTSGPIRFVPSYVCNIPVAWGRMAELPTAVAARGGARSAANAARLNRNLAAREIAGGHAFGKHADEFAALGITNRDQFARHIEDVMNNPSAFRELRNGRSAFWDDATGTVVIRNPSAVDGGAAFRPPDGRSYFERIK
jgi:filamentous hemagglutinin